MWRFVVVVGSFRHLSNLDDNGIFEILCFIYFDVKILFIFIYFVLYLESKVLYDSTFCKRIFWRLSKRKVSGYLCINGTSDFFLIHNILDKTMFDNTKKYLHKEKMYEK